MTKPYVGNCKGELVSTHRRAGTILTGKSHTVQRYGTEHRSYSTAIVPSKSLSKHGPLPYAYNNHGQREYAKYAGENRGDIGLARLGHLARRHSKIGGCYKR